MGNYVGSATANYKITENNITVKLNNTIYECTGKPLGPGLTVMNSKGTVLTRNVDYTLKYNGERIKPGIYSVTVTLKGNYRGSVTEEYQSSVRPAFALKIFTRSGFPYTPSSQP